MKQRWQFQYITGPDFEKFQIMLIKNVHLKNYTEIFLNIAFDRGHFLWLNKLYETKSYTFIFSNHIYSVHTFKRVNLPNKRWLSDTDFWNKIENHKICCLNDFYFRFGNRRLYAVKMVLLASTAAIAMHIFINCKVRCK